MSSCRLEQAILPGLRRRTAPCTCMHSTKKQATPLAHSSSSAIGHNRHGASARTSDQQKDVMKHAPPPLPSRITQTTGSLAGGLVAGRCKGSLETRRVWGKAVRHGATTRGKAEVMTTRRSWPSDAMARLCTH